MSKLYHLASAESAIKRIARNSKRKKSPLVILRFIEDIARIIRNICGILK